MHRSLLTISILAMLALTSAAVAQTTAPSSPRRASVRIVLCGDSTVTDDAGWGGVFAKCLSSNAECINLSRGGRSSRSFVAEGRWKQALDLHPDYVLIQFGHNDEPGHGPERESDPATTYRENMTRYVDEARAAGIRPILLTPMSRRQWGDDGRIHSLLRPYADVVKQIAAEKGVPLMDLHWRSIEVYESLGRQGCELISPPKPGGLDGTHLNAVGGKLFGALIAAELSATAPELGRYVRGLPPAPATAPTTVAAVARPTSSPATRNEPAPSTPAPKGTRTIIVAADGSGDFRTLQQAVAAAPANNADRTTIRIRPGTYMGQVIVSRSKPNISFVGEDAETTIISYALNVHDPVPDSVPRGLNGIGVVVQGDDFHAERITFRNSSGDHGQALALRLQGDRGVLRNCRLLGWQDTLLAHSKRQYLKDCYIEGRVDFIFGGATAVFDNCEVRSKNGGYVTAASTPQDQPYGFVFLNCRLTSSDGVPTFLGRPWRPFGSVTFLNCDMAGHIRPEGWNNWGKPENEKTARYAEYNSTGPGGNPSQRAQWSRQLSSSQADAITVESVLTGSDGWNPRLADP